jgi:hypothetical protein
MRYYQRIISRRDFLLLIITLPIFGIYALVKSNAPDKRDILHAYISNNCDKYIAKDITHDNIKVDNIFYDRQQNIIKDILNRNFNSISELKKELNNMYQDDYSNTRHILLNNWVLSETEAVMFFDFSGISG